MQITKGTVTVTNGSAVVVGKAVDWSQVNSSCLFVYLGQTYDIVSVNTAALPDPTLTLSTNFSGVTAAAQAYVIVRDFTTNFSLPLLNPGDLEAAAIQSRVSWMIDSLMHTGTGNASLGEMLITKNAHGFIVGNFLTLVGSTWQLGLSSTVSLSTIVGCVKEVVSPNQFKIVTQGFVGSLAGVTLTPGATYYLRNAPTPGGGGSVNITNQLNQTTLQVPILLADSANSGYILSLASANGATFAVGVPGIVPGPTQAQYDGNYLLGAKGWTAGSVANRSLQSQHMVETGGVDWIAFAANGTGLSILAHMNDLNNRVKTLQGLPAIKGSITLRRDKDANSTATPWENKYFTVPARITSLRITAYTGSVNSIFAAGSPNSAMMFTLPVVEGDVIRVEIGESYRNRATTGTRLNIYLNQQQVFAGMPSVQDVYVPYLVLSGPAVKISALANSYYDYDPAYGFVKEGNLYVFDNGVKLSVVTGFYTPVLSTVAGEYFNTGAKIMYYAGFAKIEYSS